MAANNSLPAALSEDPHREPAILGPFGLIWHIGTLGLLAAFLAVSIYNAANGGTLGWQHAALAAMTLAQAAIYVQTMVRTPSWPPPQTRLFLHFVVAPGLIFFEQAISPQYVSLWWVYFSFNLSGVLQPKWAFPHMALMVLLFIGSVSDWNVANLSSGVVIISAVSLIASAPFYVLIRRLFEFGDSRNQLIAELQAAYRELAEARERENDLAVLQERERLARDMHDSLGHALVALSVQLEAAQRLYKVDPVRASKQMDDMKQLTRDSMETLRRTLAGLRAPGLGERLLHQALPELCVGMSGRSGVSVSCDIDPGAATLNRTVADTLWSVSQEALTNIEKHAHARNARVRIRVEPGAVMLTVADDGSGIPSNASNRDGHYGLRGMHERVEGLGGTLHIRPNAPSGTLIEATFPNV